MTKQSANKETIPWTKKMKIHVSWQRFVYLCTIACLSEAEQPESLTLTSRISSSTRSQARDGKDKLDKLPTRSSWAPRGTLAPPPAPPTPPALRRATPPVPPTPPPSDRIESGRSPKTEAKRLREIDETKNRAGLLSAEISEKPYLWAEQGSQIGNLCRLARLGSSPLGRRGRTRTTESHTYWAAQTNHDLGFNPIKHQHIPLSLRLGEDKESMSTWGFGGAADRNHAQGSSCSPSGSLDLVLRGGRSSRRVRGRGRKDERDASEPPSWMAAFGVFFLQRSIQHP